MARKHDDIAKRIAKARDGKYDPTGTPDVKNPYVSYRGGGEGEHSG